MVLFSGQDEFESGLLICFFSDSTVLSACSTGSQLLLSYCWNAQQHSIKIFLEAVTLLWIFLSIGRTIWWNGTQRIMGESRKFTFLLKTFGYQTHCYTTSKLLLQLKHQQTKVLDYTSYGGSDFLKLPSRHHFLSTLKLRVFSDLHAQLYSGTLCLIKNLLKHIDLSLVVLL